jgi:uncharacterized protein YndB with AHSA1/START domain
VHQKLTVQTFIEAPIEKIWKYWTGPEHITQWCAASADWHAPHATNDMRVGGTFKTRMESKDGKHGFDFEGTYTAVELREKIEYIMEDGRTVQTTFVRQNNGYDIIQVFDAEHENSLEMQKTGWQSILDNFKTYVLSK